MWVGEREREKDKGRVGDVCNLFFRLKQRVCGAVFCRVLLVTRFESIVEKETFIMGNYFITLFLFNATHL